MEINEIISVELNIKLPQVDAAVKLLDEGNTVPFISRYRKEVTGGLDDEQLRALTERLSYLRNLQKRRDEVISLIEGQGKLTPELVEAINSAVTLTEVEDIYRVAFVDSHVFKLVDDTALSEYLLEVLER